jgi:hypothetical protein
MRDIALEMRMTFLAQNTFFSAIEQQTLKPIIQDFRRITRSYMPLWDRLVLLIMIRYIYLDDILSGITGNGQMNKRKPKK